MLGCDLTDFEPSQPQKIAPHRCEKIKFLFDLGPNQAFAGNSKHDSAEDRLMQQAAGSIAGMAINRAPPAEVLGGHRGRGPKAP